MMEVGRKAGMALPSARARLREKALPMPSGTSSRSSTPSKRRKQAQNSARETDPRASDPAGFHTLAVLMSMQEPPLKVNWGNCQKHVSPGTTAGRERTMIQRRWRGNLSEQIQKTSPFPTERYIVSERTARTFPAHSGKTSRSLAFEPICVAEHGERGAPCNVNGGQACVTDGSR